MKKILILFTILIAIFIMSSCSLTKKSSQKNDENEAENMDIESTLNIIDNKAACDQEGGNWEKVGLADEESCTIPAKDSGKKCGDSDECEGFCIANFSDQDWDKMAEQEEEIKASGECSESKNQLGCFMEVKKGFASYICID